MKLLFIHDGTLKYDEKGNYYGTAITPKSLERYRYLASDITIVVRTLPFSKDESRERYTKIPKEYRIKHVNNYMSLKGILLEKRKIKKELENLIRSNDLIVARFSGETGKIAASICHKINKPYIVECVGCAWDSFWNYNFKGKLIAPYQFLHQRKLIKQAPFVIYVTNEFLQRRYPTNGESIGASNVELNTLDNKVLENRLEKIDNEKNDKTLILGTAAAIDVKYKGQAYVIEAISKLKKEGLKFKYQLIGGGSEEYLRKIAKKYGVETEVEFLGTISHEKVFKWLQSIDIYIQPSNQEGLPRALIEAMSCACPSIGSTTAGIPELLDEKVIFNRKKVSNLINVIKSMDKNTRLEQAGINHENAKKYKRDFIYQRRNDFFDLVIKNYDLRRDK